MSVVYLQRDIVLVPFPFTDNATSKKRPALIISNSKVNKGQDLILLMLTTSEVIEEFGVKLDDSDLKTPIMAGSMLTTSAHCKKIAVLEKALVYKKISTIKNLEKFKEIMAKVQYGIEIEMPLDFVALVRCFFGRLCARSNANFKMRSTPVRVNTLCCETNSRSVPSNMRPPTDEYSPSVFSRTM